MNKVPILRLNVALLFSLMDCVKADCIQCPAGFSFDLTCIGGRCIAPILNGWKIGFQYDGTQSQLSFTEVSPENFNTPGLLVCQYQTDPSLPNVQAIYGYDPQKLQCVPCTSDNCPNGYLCTSLKFAPTSDKK